MKWTQWTHPLCFSLRLWDLPNVRSAKGVFPRHLRTFPPSHERLVGEALGRTAGAIEKSTWQYEATGLLALGFWGLWLFCFVAFGWLFGCVSFGSGLLVGLDFRRCSMRARRGSAGDSWYITRKSWIMSSVQSSIMTMQIDCRSFRRMPLNPSDGQLARLPWQFLWRLSSESLNIFPFQLPW